MRMKYQRYRVYPNNPNVDRARSYDYLERAKDFAMASFNRQEIADIRPVPIWKGSGSDLKKIGEWTVYGWVDYRGVDYSEMLKTTEKVLKESLARSLQCPKTHL